MYKYGYVYTEKLFDEMNDYINFLYDEYAANVMPDLSEDDYDDEYAANVMPDLSEDDYDDEYAFIDITEEINNNKEQIMDLLDKYIEQNEMFGEYNLLYNINKATSLQLKLIMMGQLYEYVNYGLKNDNCSAKEMMIYNLLDKDPSLYNALYLYEKYKPIVINLTIDLSISNEEYIFKTRKHIINDHKLKNLFKINPYSLLTYRFLLGNKFDFEDIKTVNIGNNIIDYIENLDNNKISSIESKIINGGYDIYCYNDQLGYIFSNVYEHLLTKNTAFNFQEALFFKLLEEIDLNDISAISNYDPNVLALLINYFYVVNKNNINEQELYQLRENTKRQGKMKIIKKINPYYQEENSYFDNTKK